RITADFNSYVDSPMQVEQLASGKYLALGQGTSSGQVTRIEMARFNADGTLDTTFGTSGKTTFVVPSATAQLVAGGGSGFGAKTAYIQADGSILVGGTATISGANNVFLAKFTADGILDTTYGTGGVAKAAVTLDTASNAVMTQDSSGNVFFAGRSSTAGR